MEIIVYGLWLIAVYIGGCTNLTMRGKWMLTKIDPKRFNPGASEYCHFKTGLMGFCTMYCVMWSQEKQSGEPTSSEYTKETYNTVKHLHHSLYLGGGTPFE